MSITDRISVGFNTATVLVRERVSALVSYVRDKASVLVSHVRIKPSISVPAEDMPVLADTQLAPRGPEVNLYVGNWQDLGTTVEVPQYSFDIRYAWIDNAGQDHEWEQTLVFPNALNQISKAKVREKIEEWLIEIARVKAGIDS